MNGLKCSWRVQQGNGGTFRAEGLGAFAVLWLRAAANLAATRWAGGWAVKETLSIYLPVLIASECLLCQGVTIHLCKRQLLKGQSID